MKSTNITISRELPIHEKAVEHLSEIAFGPGRFTRTAFRLREGVQSRADLSFVAFMGDDLIGSVRLTEIRVGDEQSLLLGPLVVNPKYKNCGFGRRLMRHAVDAARAAGEKSIILVGDEPYYGRFGFEKLPLGAITMPGPVDPGRVLVCHLQENRQALRGAVRKIYTKGHWH